MSSPAHDAPLTPDDLAVLRRVLDASALATGRKNLAALLVIRLFHSGMTRPQQLAEAINRCIADDDVAGAGIAGHPASGSEQQSSAGGIKTIH
ncbi:hypothetical protein EPK99_11850 [Neorhizobium lilium]|uniref:Uncharacterized protein n=1 Tax=Neorhizobium lilium TaxID=2503024 RepID=A0A3S3U0T0_9HYPH|nr:hypothetical protein [Neorhizobium lilium]RWX79245.1 hypothetical protein EPK99_11850 [Neorhizobium lilium]